MSELRDGFSWQDSLYLPGYNEQDAYRFLSAVDSGGIGGGYGMIQMSSTIPAIRDAYNNRLQQAVKEAAIRRTQMTAEAFDLWRIEERTRIAHFLRKQQGVVPSTFLDMRDWIKYGDMNRSPDSLIRRKIRNHLNITGEALDYAAVRSKVAAGFAISNKEVTKAAASARYLKYGGRVFFVVGLGSSAYTIVTANEQERLKVAAREGAGIAGGALGTSVGVGLAIAFGIVTGGWGLVAVGLIAGAGGGVLAEYGADRFLFPHDSERVVKDLNASGMIDHTALTRHFPHR